MPQHLLHRPQIRPVLNHMRSETVPERVWRNLFPDTGCKRLRLDHIEHGDTAEGTPEAVQEQDVLGIRVRRIDPCVQILPDGIRRLFSERDDALLVTLADDAYESFFHINV